VGKCHGIELGWGATGKKAYNFLCKIRFYSNEVKRAQIEAFLECFALYANLETRKSKWSRIEELKDIVKKEKKSEGRGDVLDSDFPLYSKSLDSTREMEMEEDVYIGDDEMEEDVYIGNDEIDENAERIVYNLEMHSDDEYSE